MNKSKFEKLIQVITKRDLNIITDDIDIQFSKTYVVCRTLPITQRHVCFEWKTASSDDKLLRSFITAFTTKYKEPNPRAYDWSARTYGEKALWENKSDEEKEYAYGHHSSNMFSKEELLKQIEANFNNMDIEDALLKYGFYATEYGIGIFCFWETPFVTEAISKMKHYLKTGNIPFANEYSDARWVYRFKLGLTKAMHAQIIQSFTI